MTTTENRPELKGVHHTARPTWKLRETVEFYRDTLGLSLVHAISARGWGPSNHPDFLHFFFDSGKGSTIAFFYYIGADQPDFAKAVDDYRYRATHTAWAVDTLDEVGVWKKKLETAGVHVRYQIRHELIESIYFNDPNGYSIEITMQVRPMGPLDATDALLTLETAMAHEDAFIQNSVAFQGIDQVWRDKASRADAVQTAPDIAALFVLDVPEFHALVDAGRADANCQVQGPEGGYWRILSRQSIRFERRTLRVVPAIWNAALTGGFRGQIASFDRDTLEIRPGATV